MIESWNVLFRWVDPEKKKSNFKLLFKNDSFSYPAVRFSYSKDVLKHSSQRFNIFL